MSSKLKSFSPFSFLPLSLSLPLSFDKCFDVSPLWNNWRSANFAQPIEISIRDRSNLTAPDAITIIYLKLLENNLILFRNPSFPLPPKSTKWKRALSNYSTRLVHNYINSFVELFYLVEICQYWTPIVSFYRSYFCLRAHKAT